MTMQARGWASFEAPTRRHAERAERAPTEAEARAPRLPIARVEHFMLADLAGAAREKLVDDTYRISRAYFPDDSRGDFEDAFLRGDPTWMFLFYGSDGTLAGFSAVSNLWVEHEGKEHAAFKGVVCIDARYKLTWRARLPVVREALRFKLRHPWTPAGYMGMAATPSGYRLLTSSLARVYPSRRAPAPASIKALMLKGAKMRGFDVVDRGPLLVPATSRLAHLDRVRESQSLKDDPDARYFVEQNPDFDQFYMLVWAPLTLGNLACGAARTLVRHLLRGARAKA